MLATSTARFFDHSMRKMLFLPPRASTYAGAVDHLHYFVILTTTAGALGAGTVGLYLFVRYRRRAPGTRGGTRGSGPLMEVLFIGTPLTFFLIWLGMGLDVYMRIITPPADAMQIYVIAKQWMWKFKYPGGPVAEGVLHVPKGRPVKLLMTSRDVIHSFYVPAFRAKRDVLPGRYTEYWFDATRVGTYELFCAQYCGTGHSFMRGQVVVMPPKAFDAWLAAHERGHINQVDASSPPGLARSPGDLAREGERVAAQKGCLKCHSIDGSRHIGPTWLGMYHRVELLIDGHKVRVDGAYITRSMMQPDAQIVLGFPPAMPSYQGRITPVQTAAIIEFIKSLRSPKFQFHSSMSPPHVPP